MSAGVGKGSEDSEGSEGNGERLFTRREWLTRRALLQGAGPMLAREAVASTRMSHPDWDMDGEHKTLAEWDAGTLRGLPGLGD